MRHICLYFQVHQPFRLRIYRFFDIGQSHDYYHELNNRVLMQRIAKKMLHPHERPPEKTYYSPHAGKIFGGFFH